ncbi:hypothetical protein [Dactylosporangium sp. CA-233914]|uniref:hypothetical protein n=1 Tax=Dactylosporangium sp. CA-233914 TaxID=3239934 RepID=UPI003D9263DF
MSGRGGGSAAEALVVAAPEGIMVAVYELDVVAPDSLGRFVYRWYGPPDRPPAVAVQGEGEGEGVGVPGALLEWHRLAARYTFPLSRDHVMLPPGGARFWQGADDWYSYDADAFRDGVADPEVIESDERRTGLGLSRFLVYAAVYEATYAPVHGLVLMQPGAGALRAVKVRLRELDDGLWQWPDPATRYYGDDDLLGHLGPDRIVIAARHRDALGRFDGLALPWDWDSRSL